MSVEIAGIEFGYVDYDAKADVLYLHVGDRTEDSDWDETVEGDGVSYGADGRVLGFTILHARQRLEDDGELVLTLPSQRLVTRDLGNALAHA